METRMERYAKYREQIRRMAPMDFPSADSRGKARESIDPEFSMPYDDEGFEEVAHNGPYLLYLSRRKRWLVIKIVLLLLAIGGFVLWWFLLQGRK